MAGNSEPVKRPLLRVGHKGAHTIAPGNTLPSFDAALQCGVDMIEFDVLPNDWWAYQGGELYLAHHPIDLPGAITLRKGLEHLASSAFDSIKLDVDLKLPGYEIPVVKLLREFGLIDRVLISSQFMSSLYRIRNYAPEVKLGWSIPRSRRDYTASKLWAAPTIAGLYILRSLLPSWVESHIRRGDCDAVMVFQPLVSERLVRAILQLNAEIYVWTVDRQSDIQRFERMGVTGIITNDPRLFTQQD